MNNMLKLIGLIFIINCCSPKGKIEHKSCDEYNVLSKKYIDNFFNYHNFAYLDTALMYIDTAILSCNNYKKLFSLRKLSVFSIMQEYDNAIMFIDNLDSDFNKDLPYFTMLLKNRFMAMQYELNNDYTRRDSCLNIVLNGIESFLFEKKGKIDSLLGLPDLNLIMSSKISTSLVQYYYYKSIIKGIDFTLKEIRDKQVKTGGNEEFFKYIEICLEKDFMTFIGI